MMNYSQIVVLLLTGIGVYETTAAPLVARMQLCQDKAKAAVSMQKYLDKISKKMPLKYVQLSNDQQIVVSYPHILFTPQGGVQTEAALTKDGGIFKRIRPCKNCVFSPWQYIKNHPYVGKKLFKKLNITIFPSGVMQLPDGTLVE